MSSSSKENVNEEIKFLEDYYKDEMDKLSDFYKKKMFTLLNKPGYEKGN